MFTKKKHEIDERERLAREVDAMIRQFDGMEKPILRQKEAGGSVVDRSHCPAVLQAVKTLRSLKASIQWNSEPTAKIEDELEAAKQLLQRVRKGGGR